MYTTLRVISALLCIVSLSGCTQLVTLLAPALQGSVSVPVIETVTYVADQANSDEGAVGNGECMPEDIECALSEGTIIQLTAVCEIPASDDDCIGTFVYRDWFLEPKSSFTAHHEGDGTFEVTLFRSDGSSEVLFSATGIYTSETVTLLPTGIVSMTVQSTGPWYIDVKRLE